MLETTLIINSSIGEQVVKLDGASYTLGRTTQSDLALPDAGLSRRHATFENHNGEIWLFDENSTNGTFVNGERIAPDGRRLIDGDEITLGNETVIFVQIRQRSAVSRQPSAVNSQQQSNEPLTKDKGQRTKDKGQRPIPTVLIVAAVSSVFIIALAVGGILVARSYNPPTANKTKTPVPQSSDIPITVYDPLKGDPDDIQDLLALLAETQEEIDASQIEDVKADTAETTEDDQSLNVTRAFWEEQKAKALAPRSGPTGISPPGLSPPRELAGDGVIKQKAKLREMMEVFKYQQPMDFGDLAQKRLAKELVELPMATNSFYLEVGSSATEEPFTEYSFENGNALLTPGSPKLTALQQLAGNFSGAKYDVGNGQHRKQMRIRLLRMFHPRALPILKELGDAYRAKFNRPLRVTSLTRSMDYQIALNKVNANSFKVRGPGSLPPHTSGCAFDLGRKRMSVEEQNFVMQKLAEMENRGVLDALIEYNVNACFHVFIYPDGKPAKM